MNSFSVGTAVYSAEKPLLIAELGTGHGGETGKAKELVAAAAACGADCVKTQIVFADEILHPNTGTTPLHGGDIPLYDVFRKLETNRDFYAEITASAEAAGLLFLATPFGPRSAALLKSLRPALVKIASPELNYTALLAELAAWNMPALLSTGVSRLADIEEAAAFFPRENLCLLHCVTAYPAPEADYNLALLASLRAIFGIPCGVSDHSLDPVLVPALSVVCGACVIEKHFCLSRDGDGLDDKIALTPADFARMTAAVRRFAAMERDDALAALQGEYGAERVRAVLGDGVKRLAPSEAANYGRTNRSLHALRAIAKGGLIPQDMVAPLGTEKRLRPGLPPSSEKKIAGRIARNTIDAGEGIGWEDI
jgi:sialic acid synthase SpsE